MKRYRIEVAEYDDDAPTPRLVDNCTVEVSDHVTPALAAVASEATTAYELRLGLESILAHRAKRAEDRQ